LKFPNYPQTNKDFSKPL